MSRSRDYDDVALVAPVSIGYARESEHGAPWFIGRALAAMLRASKLKKRDVDGLAAASFTLTPDTAVSLTDYLRMTPRWLNQIVTGGANGIVAMQRAARAVQCGDADIVACIAGDTRRPESFRELVANFSTFSRDSVYPYGAAGPNAVFALITRNYMDKFGATREDFGRICVAQRHNARHFAGALLKKSMTMEDYLAARPIAEPLHLLDCVMPCAGAEGFLVMSKRRARKLKLPFARVLSIGELHNAYAGDAVHFRGGWAAYRDQLYAAADREPRDIDFVETYDDYPVIAMMQLEDLGFCRKGQGPDFVRKTALTFDGGGLPMNTSGGQLSAGQAGAAGGFLGLVEAIRQLSGGAAKNRVPGAKLGLVSGYGMVNYDRCLCTAAAILRKGD
jgi:acetyl-CoA acetyltransferase